MAEEVIKIELGGSGGQAQSLQSLKKEYSDLQKELTKTTVGSKEYIETLKKLGATKDEIGDLRDTISALNPEGKVAAFAKVGSTIASGFAAAQGAAALFGAESEELQKTMLKVQAAMALAEGIKGISGAADAFKVLNTVMRSNPIFLIVGAITAVGAALFALKDKIGFIGDAFEVIGDVIGLVMDKVTEFTDAIGLSNSALDKQGKALTASINSSTEALKTQTQAYDDQIAIAKASGKSTIDLEIAKQKAIIETNKALVEQTIAYVRQGGELDKERAKLLTEQIEGIKKANVAIQVIEATAQKENLENYKKHLEEKKTAEQKHLDELYQMHLNEVAKFNQARADEAKLKAEQDAQERANIEALNRQDNAENLVVSNQKIEVNRQTEEEIRAEKQKTVEQNLATTKQGLQAAQALTDLYFGHQLRQAKGNAEKEKEIRKKQFQVNKAFGIANAVVDGFGAVQKALNNPYPLNLVLAVISGVLAAANVAKIATTKFDDGGSSSAGASDIGGGISTGAAPVVPQPNNTVTKIDDSGKADIKQPVVKAVVVETDITDKQKRVNTIEESAKFG